MVNSDSPKKRRTQEEIIDRIYEALSEDDLRSVKGIAALAEVDRETCKRNLEVLAHAQSKQQGVGWLIVQHVKDENQQISQTLYKRAKKKRGR